MWVANNDFQALCPDGSDAGFVVASVDGGKLRCDYRTHLYGRKVLRAYDMNAVGEYYRNDSLVRMQRRLYPDRADYGREEYANCVYVNYWGYLPGHRVELFEGGVPARSRAGRRRRPALQHQPLPARTGTETRLQEGRCQGRQPPHVRRQGADGDGSRRNPDYGCRRRSPCTGRRSNVPRNSTRRRGNLSILF